MHIVLVGMMASGKSSVGKVLSKSMNIPFLDIDKEIEFHEKSSIKSIFENDGEKYFRKLERKIIIENLEKKKTTVIALGGGAFLNAAVRKKVNEKSVSVWLDVNMATIIRRLKKNRNRPLIENKSDEDIKKIYEKRLKYYEMAKIHIDCNKKTKIECVEELISQLKSIGINESN
tara:strand:+ start:1649 stop:2170 length:522 start_codon:yes stop_codon:yes gene_type:complete